MTTLKLGLNMSTGTLHQDALTSCTGVKSITVPQANTYFFHQSTGTGDIFGKKKANGVDAESVLWISVASTSITIPASVTAIGRTALQSCPGLTSVTVASGSTTFKVGCSGKVVLDNWNGGFYRARFAIGSAVEITIDSTVTHLESTCFRGSEPQ